MMRQGGPARSTNPWRQAGALPPQAAAFAQATVSPAAPPLLGYPAASESGPRPLSVHNRPLLPTPAAGLGSAPPMSQPVARPPLKTSSKAAERIFVDALTVGTLDGNTLLTGFRSKLPPVRHNDGSPPTASFLDVDFDKGCFFFRLFCDDGRECDALYPLEGEVLFLDIISRGVALQRATRDGREVVDLTFTSRRPPKLWVKLKELIDVPEGENGEEMASQWKRERRQATELDFAVKEEVMVQRTVMGAGDELRQVKERVKRQKTEGEAGPVSVLRARRKEYELAFEPAIWHTYRFTLPLSRLGLLADIVRRLSHLADRELDHQLMSPSALDAARLAPGVPEEQPFPLPDIGPLTKEPFELRYLVEGLMARRVVLESEVAGLLRAVRESCGLDEQKARRILEALYQKERVSSIDKVVKDLADNVAGAPVRPADKSRIEVQRALMTPFRLLPFPALPEESNRVLQEYARRGKAGHFLRLRFGDEDDSLFVDVALKTYDDSHPKSSLLGRIRRALKHGVRIGGRLFKFLAFGESQARERSCWFVWEEGDVTADSVRKWMGDFSREKVAAKYAARMGLCFSASRLAFPGITLKKIKDIKGSTGALFTDGVGIAHPGVLEAAAATLGKADSIVTTAVQVRIGGIKGLVVGMSHHPQHGHVPEGTILYRPSMLKFKSNDRGLQVMKVSTFSFAFLNRQHLAILSYLGAKDDDIMAMFKHAIRQAKKIGSAAELGWTDPLEEGEKDDDLDPRVYAQSSFPIERLLAHGFNEEPLLKDVLKALETRVLQDLKHRARVEVRQGVFLLGIADEYGVLAEGEVFCQVEDPRQPELGRKVLTGQACIMRAPALHPGDVRLVRAVDKSDLRGFVNVIVFATRGGRDLPSQLGGGDLDGDMFSLLFDPRLLPRRQVEPFDYTSPPPLSTAEIIRPEHLQEYLVSYMKHDNLGAISNAHMALADMYGLKHELCLELCAIHSAAVDYPKTGLPAIHPPKLRPLMWPDFANKAHLHSSKTYASEHILGIIYRHLPEPSFAEEQRAHPFLDRRLAAVPVPDHYVSEALRLKRAYDGLLAGLMRRYALSEYEVVGGLVLKTQRRRVTRDESLREMATHAYADVAHTILEDARCWVLLHPLPPTNLPPMDHLARLAVAAYKVTKIQEAIADGLLVDRSLTNDLSPALLDAITGTLTSGEDGGSQDDPDVPAPALHNSLASFPFIFAEQLCRAVEQQQQHAEQPDEETRSAEGEGWD